MRNSLPQRDVVLLGIGHTNAHVLRMWRMQPIAGARLTCVSNFPIATYSGMLPGVLAGQYATERMQIDLVRLCAASGARFVHDEVTGLDVDGRHLLLADRPPIPFDALSIGIGSVPTFEGVEEADETLLAIKPMQTFIARLEARLQSARDRHRDRPLRLAVVGGGAAGCELAFCLPRRVELLFGKAAMEITLIHAGEQLVMGALDSTSQRARRELEQRNVRLLLGERVKRAYCGTIELESGRQLDVDVALWATSAAAPPLLAKLNLPTDEDGFLLTDATLQTTAQAPIFAVGDTGTIESEHLPKAGVYAVRQAPVLWKNIQRLLAGERLVEYRPQRSFLKLLNTGDGRAIGEYPLGARWGITLHNRWMWKLKDAIDSKFIDKYQDYRPTEMSPAGDEEERSAAMRCAGCGGKVAGSVLSRVLARLDVPPSEHVLVGLEKPDDAAVVQTPGGRPMTLTVDFFASPLDDPYLVGRIAVLNAASDVFALGGKPLAALAMITLPVGKPAAQEELLLQLLVGSMEELRKMGATLVGGHTIEGPQLSIGFTIAADQGEQPPRTKDRLRAGDRLILTKPLGVGVLLAAHMQAKCRAEWMEELLKTMLASNQTAAGLLNEFGIAGVTDVTGFGLAGHLLEMLEASRVQAKLRLDAIPLLPGAAELIDAGVESTLAPANRAAEAAMQVAAGMHNAAHYKALFDPQTSGGLLMGVAADRVDDFRLRLSELGASSAVIGQIVTHGGSIIVVE